MPRGKAKPKTSLVDQINAKEESIAILEKQLKGEKDALKALKQAQTAEEVESLHRFISTSNLTPEKAIEILKEHTQSGEAIG